MCRNSDCKGVAEQLWNYMSHRLDEQQTERIERHLSECDACRAEADAYRQTADALKSFRSAQLPESRRGWRDLETRLLETPRRRTLVPGSWLGARGMALGTLAAGVVLGIVFLPRAQMPVKQAENDPGHAAVSDGGQIAGADPHVDSEPGGLTESELASALASIRDEAAHVPALRVHHTALVRTARTCTRWSSTTTPADHVRLAYAHTSIRRERTIALRRAGAKVRQPAAPDTRDYVLSPVSATSESDSGAQYIMGSLVLAGRSDDTEVARAW